MLMLIQCVGFPFTLPVYVWISIKCKKVVPEVEGNKNVNDKISNINLRFKGSHVHNKMWILYNGSKISAMCKPCSHP